MLRNAVQHVISLAHAGLLLCYGLEHTFARLYMFLVPQM